MSSNRFSCLNPFKYIAGVVVSIIFILAVAFFLSGDFSYGFVMVGLLVLLIWTSKIDRDRNDGNSLSTEAETQQDARRTSEVSADIPPSYRLTWRRSFIRKFKTSPSADPETTAARDQANATASGNREETSQGDDVTSVTSSMSANLQDGLPSYDQAIKFAESKERY